MTDQENKPYVRYLLSADTAEKGIGFAIQKAVQTFITSNGYRGTVSVKDRSSDKFEAIISLFDNGKYDFNMNSLLAHIQNSGRLPSNKNIHPTVGLKPLPCDSSINISQTSRKDDAWIKTIEDLNQKLKASEKTVSSLTSAMSERQKVIDEKSTRIVKLEEIVTGITPSHFENSLSAILRGYASNYAEELFMVAEDFGVLQDQGDSGIFIDLEGKKIEDRKDYINKRFGYQFATEEEVAIWVDRVKGHSVWDDTDDAREIQRKIGTYSVDDMLLKEARDKGASETLIKIMEQALKERKGSTEELAAKEQLLRKSFERDKSQVGSVENSYNLMKKFNEVVSNSQERLSRGSVILPLTNILNQASGVISVYIPSLYSGNNFDLMVSDQVRAILAGNYSFEPNMKESGFYGLDISSKGEDIRNAFFALSNPDSVLSRDRLLSLLGVRVQPTGIII